MEPIKLFISYSHVDEDLRLQLEKHLQILKRNRQIELWHDRKITAGSEFKYEIDKNLQSSQVILLLISSDFIASDYCYDIEMTEALRLHHAGASVVVPIILRDCRWHNAPFGKLTALPTDGKAITGKDWYSIDEAFTDVERGIENVITSFQKREIESIVEEKLDSKTLSEALELFKIEGQKLDYKSTKEDFKNFEALKREIYHQLFDDFDLKIENTPKLREKQPEELFEVICASETIDQLTFQKIQKVRQNKDLYMWYERIVVTSAITLSLISYKKFDQQKVNLLIDFLTDFEDLVWENALTGLVLGLVHHQNKWGRFSGLKKRLEMLQNIQKVQDGLNIIESILRLNTFQGFGIDGKIYSLEFFKTPSNCFLPFYKNNPATDFAIQNSRSSMDIDSFLEALYKAPLLNMHKYAACFIIDKFDINLEKKDILLQTNDPLHRELYFSSVFYPYQNIISNYNIFFKFYPIDVYEDIFSNHLSISKTKLKDVILNKTNHLRLTASSKFDEKKYIEAISLLIDLIKILPEDVGARWNIAECYILVNPPNFDEAVQHLLRLEELKKNDIAVLLKIAVCYSELNMNEDCLKYLEKAQELDPQDEELLLKFADFHFSKLDDADKALEILKSGCSVYPKSFKFPRDIADIYQQQKKFELAIEYYFTAISLCPKELTYKFYGVIAGIYEDLNQIDKALESALKMIELESESSEANLILGRVYFIGKLDLKAARKHIEKSIKLKKIAQGYGNLAHIDLCEKDERKAFENYAFCLEMLGDKDEFYSRINKDLKYITQFDITEEEYFRIRDEVIAKKG